MKNRTFIKKIIYRLFGSNAYTKAYAYGKIKDIKKGNNLESEAAFLKHFVQKNDTALDIGANYGHYSVLLSELAPQGKIISFEPIPFTFNILKKVVKHFKLSNIEIYNFAVSDSNKQVYMSVPKLDFGGPNTGIAHITSEKNSESVEITTKNLDGFIPSINPKFIKIDIEGHEPEALAGMEKILTNSCPVILIEFSHSCLSRAGHDPVKFASYLFSLNYNFYKADNNKLIEIKDTCPPDGYYFLISEKNKNLYNDLINENSI